MKYLVHWHLSHHPAIRAAAKQFLETDGKLPEGLTVIGRWFGTNGRGCLIIEAADAKQVFALVTEWSEYVEVEATPALDDEEAKEVFGKLFG